MKKRKQPEDERAVHIEAAVKSIMDNLKTIRDNQGKVTDFELWDLSFFIGECGFSLVQTKTLAEYYIVKEFCDSNHLEIVNDLF